MSEPDEFGLLSIIKVEPEEFEINNQATSYSDESQRNSVENLARKGNEGKLARDPHICCFCQKSYSTRRVLKIHLEKIHCRKNKMDCDHCPKFFFTRNDILKHIKVHKTKVLVCGVCDYKTANKRRLESHKRTHAVKTECPVCKKHFALLENHIQSVHNEENIQKCETCHEIFETRENLRRHTLRQHHVGKLFECHCGSVLKTKDGLRKHQHIHKRDPLACAFCQKHFASFSSLERHCRVMRHTTEKPRVLNTSGPFICDKCETKLSTRKSFRSHAQRHRKHVFIFCDLCPRSFTQRHYLIKHIRQVHLKRRPFKCAVCEFKSFSNKTELKAHMLQHSSKTECKVCHKLVANVTGHSKRYHKGK